MTAVVTKTLGALVNEVRRELYVDTEWPRVLTITEALDATETAVDVSSVAGMAVSTLIEVDYELMAVTADPTASPITVIRGVAGTTAATHAINAQALIDPAYSKLRVRQALLRAFQHLHSSIPNVVSETYQREDDLNQVVLPANTMRVWDVRMVIEQTGKTISVGDWTHQQDLPTTVAATGQLLVPGAAATNTDDFLIRRQIPWWFYDTSAADGTLTDDPADDDTIDMPAGIEDLPVLYALAYVQMNREVARGDLTSVAEWTEEQARASGVNLRVLLESWRLFYRRMDEAKTTMAFPIRRPYRKMSKGLV